MLHTTRRIKGIACCFIKRQFQNASSRVPKVLAEFLHQYPVVSKIRVKWGELDAYQHVNNCEFFRYQEVARLQYFSAVMNEIKTNLDPKRESTEFNIDEFITGRGVGPILSETHCKYRFPLTFPDLLIVGAKVEKEDFFENRFVMRYVVWSLRHQKPASEGTGTVVVVDYNTGRPVDKIPKLMLDGMEAVSNKNSLHLVDTLQLVSDMGVVDKDGGDYL
jgi:acyl-CoA thioester hydrolase